MSTRSPVPDRRTITDLLADRTRSHPGHVVFDVQQEDGTWRPITTRAFEQEVRDLARGLVAIGIEPGDRIAIAAATRYAWTLTDFAAWYAGAVTVPIYPTSAPVQAGAQLRDARASLAVGGTAADAEMLEAAALSGGLAGLPVRTMDPGPADLERLVVLGAEVDPAKIDRRRRLASPDDPATIVHTSGTTGEPRGARITHRNLLGTVDAVAGTYSEIVHDGGRTVIALPLAHILARGLQLICIARGMRIAHVPRREDLLAAFAQLRPTFLVVVPRLLEKILEEAADRASQARLTPLWKVARRDAIARGRALEAADRGTPGRMPLGARCRRPVLDRLLHRRLRAVLGGSVEHLLCGGAPLDPEVSLFFRGIGIPVIEGYGLTETTGPIVANPPDRIRSGTAGLPLPGGEVRIADSGVVLVRGPGVITGYDDPSHDAAAFDDGWLHTGDLGRLEQDGFLVLTGRLKDIIVTANGKNVNPGPWEAAVESDALIEHAVMVGDHRPYLAAVIVLDPTHAKVAASPQRSGTSRGTGPRPDDGRLRRIDDPHLRAAVSARIDAANAQRSRPEQVRRFVLTTAGTELAAQLRTPTLKLRRHRLTEAAADLIEEMYAAHGQHPATSSAPRPRYGGDS